jgi:O-antigen ligase
MQVRINLNPKLNGQTIRPSLPFRSPGQTRRSASPKTVVWQIILCCVPATLFLYDKQLFLAVLSFHSLLAILGLYYALRQQTLHVTALVLGCVPMLMLLRPIFYQNSISVVLVGLLVLWSIFHPAEIRRLGKDRVVFSMCAFAFAYWWLSVLVTGYYATNLRVFELTFGAAVVRLLGRSREFLSASLWGVGASTLLIVIGISPYGKDRLGMAEYGHQLLGHPQQVGMVCSLILILCLADQGRWLGLARHTIWRYVAAALATTILVLTTSRTSWLLAVTGLGALLLARGQRRYIVGSALILMVALAIVFATNRGQTITRYVEKVISPKRSLSQRTSGRYDMYAAFPGLFWQSPIWGLGPGAAENAYKTADQTPLVMHSIFLHMGLELGTIGLVSLLVMYLAFVRRAWVYQRVTGDVVPLAFALACWVDALAHNSFNPLTGIYLGLALTNLSGARVYRVVSDIGSRRLLARGSYGTPSQTPQRAFAKTRENYST